jgi:hypothetical protein
MFQLLLLTKNVALACIPAILAFLLLQRKFRGAAYALASIAIVRGAYELLRGMIWERSDQFASQTAILLQKDPYDASKGHEDVAGFVDRFFGNIDLYISKRFYQILGFRGPDEVTVNSALSFVTIVVLILTFVTVIRRKNKALLMAGMYALCMAGLTFLVLQTRWDQPRYFIVYVHFFLLILLYGLFVRLKKGGPLVQRLYWLLAGLLIASSLIGTVARSSENIDALRHNLKGDLYYGHTPDFVNYLKLSKWCADSLPQGTLVAARKAPMSFIYSGGKTFYPIYSAVTTDPDSVIALFKRDSVTHVILANLRRNPKVNDGFIINTVHRMVQPMATKYPGKLQLVKQMGDSEPAYLYRIVY